MQARLLVFDPDIEGRRSIRTALSSLDLELSLIVRATGKTASDTLNEVSLDGILIGLPADLAELVPIFSQLQAVGNCPPIFFFHEVPTSSDLWFTKDETGFQNLADILLPEIRAFKLGNAASSLNTFLGQGEGSARSNLADRVIDLLAGMDISAMYVSVDQTDYRWNLRSSNFHASVNEGVIAITGSHGGVAPNPETLNGALKQLYTGELDDHVFTADDLLSTIVPVANRGTLDELGTLLGVSSIYVLAVRTNDLLNGFLLLGHQPQPQEREALRQLADQFGSLLAQAENYDLLNQRAKTMQALQEVMLSLSVTQQPDDLLDTVLEKLEQVVPYDLAVIALFEQEKLSVRASRGDPVGAGAMERSFTDVTEQPDIVARIVASGKPVRIITPVGEDAQQDTMLESVYASWLGVPISWGSAELGFLFMAAEDLGVLEAIHLEICIGFARELAIALQNAELLQGSRSRAEKLRLVNDIGRYAISVLDPQQLVEEVATRVCEVFEYYAVRILLFEGDDLVPYALGGAEAGVSVDPDHVIALDDVQEISHVVQTDSPLYLDSRSPRWREVMPQHLDGAQAVVFIPLSVVSEVIGVMEVYAQTNVALGQEDIDILQVLAAQIAISVVNARLFNEIRSHALELESRVEMRTQELQSQKERTEAILRSVADAVLVLDLSGEVVLTNPPAEELLEGSHGQGLLASIRGLFVAEGVIQSSVEIGEITFQALASAVELEGVAQGTVVVLRDITQLKELDHLKSQFVATVSHELRTPLTNIKLYLSLLHSAEEGKRARYHKVLVRETERLSHMIEDLLDLSRLETQGVLEKEDVSLANLLRLVADNHEPACVSKGVEFSKNLDRQLRVIADRAQMIQVFTNLLANAIAYTPVGGKISLNIVGIEQIESRQYAKVVLEDTGIGIRKEDIPHVFDRFYRGAGAQNYQAEGSGLGLAIVREILDNHDAKIAVDSQPGKGTKFTVWLPAQGK